MGKVCVVLGWLFALVLLVPPQAAGQKKPAKPKEDQATKDDYKAAEGLKEIEGDLTDIEPSTMHLTVKVAYGYLVPNPQYRPNNNATNRYVRQMNRLMQQQQQAMNIQNPIRRLQKLQQLAAQGQALQLTPPVGPSPYQMATAYKDFAAEVPEAVVVRRLNLPMEYDEKGNVKEYSDKEKKELRGKDPKMPGYAAKWDDVQIGQKVKLYLGKKKAAEKGKKNPPKADDMEAAKADDKGAPKAADKEKPADKDAIKDKAADKKAKVEEDTEEPRVHAWMILIEAEPDLTRMPQNNPQKKKQSN
jgi:hypothetical protein